MTTPATVPLRPLRILHHLGGTAGGQAAPAWVASGLRPLDGSAAPADIGKEGGLTKLERCCIPGPAGKLEALFEWAPQISPQLTAVVCHPHPLYGGTLHNKVVFHAAKGTLQAGLPTLSFNFRGVGKSQGSYDGGQGEQDDVRAAIDYLQTRFPAARVCVIGFSFGAWVGLTVGAADRRVAALAGLGIPVAAENMSFLREVRKPKLIVQGTEDIFGPKEQVEALFAEMPEPKRLQWVQGVDHFFKGKLPRAQDAVRRFLEEVARGSHGWCASHRADFRPFQSHGLFSYESTTATTSFAPQGLEGDK